MCAPEQPLPLHYLKSNISFLKHTYSHLTLTDSQIDRQPAHQVSSKPMNHNRKGERKWKASNKKEIRDGENTKHLPVSVIVVFQTTRDSVCLEMTSYFLRKLPPALAKQTYFPESCILQQLWKLLVHGFQKTLSKRKGHFVQGLPEARVTGQGVTWEGYHWKKTEGEIVFRSLCFNVSIVLPF